jgi:hypothetical protein
MSDKQQTPVEWLIEQFWNNEGMLTSKKLEKALEMEKDQMEEQYEEGREIGKIEILAMYATNNSSETI